MTPGPTQPPIWQKLRALSTVSKWHRREANTLPHPTWCWGSECWSLYVFMAWHLIIHHLWFTYKTKSVGNKFSPTDKSSTFSNHTVRYTLVTTKVYAALFVYTVAWNSDVLISAQDSTIHNTVIQNFFWLPNVTASYRPIFWHSFYRTNGKRTATYASLSADVW
jgi:hypothetical protein